jgi:xylulokinase
VPVSADRKILGPSILHYDSRGQEFVESLAEAIDDKDLYQQNGNTLGNYYTLTKLMWVKKYQPELYEKADKFLHWSGLIAFLLGAEAAVDYSLANRTLLFDLETQDWSDHLINIAGLDKVKLPRTVPSGTVIGTVSKQIALELNLPLGAAIVSGAHDQCANAVGCGVISPGNAVFGMGTFLCITPVFSERKDHMAMSAIGLNTEHHAVPGNFVSFLYNQGGALTKWFRDVFARGEYRMSVVQGKNIYTQLFSEIPVSPSNLFVIPHFTATGPPDFLSNSSGLISGLHLETTRGEILKGILEGINYYLMVLVNLLPGTGIEINAYRAVGGGSQSDAWVQLSADMFGKPFVRPLVTEAGALGAAIMAGVGQGAFSSYAEGVEMMVKLDTTFTPDPARYQHYQEQLNRYQELVSITGDFLQRSTD